MTDFLTPLADDEYFLLKLIGEFAFTKKVRVAEDWDSWRKLRPEREHITVQRVQVSVVNPIGTEQLGPLNP